LSLPAYNCDRFLPKAIESVLRQTMAQHEAIVIDDSVSTKSGRFGIAQ
jgi:glycosyltransferase involved in cell wall biosynthesis